MDHDHEIKKPQQDAICFAGKLTIDHLNASEGSIFSGCDGRLVTWPKATNPSG